MKDGLTADQAAHAVGVARSTLYRWQTQPAPKSRRPHRLRANGWSRELRAEVERLRLDFPFWGKDKLGPLLRKAGHIVSNATVGRILKSLVERGRGGDTDGRLQCEAGSPSHAIGASSRRRARLIAREPRARRNRASAT
jgi:hypothetical protein